MWFTSWLSVLIMMRCTFAGWVVKKPIGVATQ
jgi:hypothetical protein